MLSFCWSSRCSKKRWSSNLQSSQRDLSQLHGVERRGHEKIKLACDTAYCQHSKHRYDVDDCQLFVCKRKIKRLLDCCVPLKNSLDMGAVSVLSVKSRSPSIIPQHSSRQIACIDVHGSKLQQTRRRVQTRSAHRHRRRPSSTSGIKYTTNDELASPHAIEVHTIQDIPDGRRSVCRRRRQSVQTNKSCCFVLIRSKTGRYCWWKSSAPRSNMPRHAVWVGDATCVLIWIMNVYIPRTRTQWNDYILDHDFGNNNELSGLFFVFMKMPLVGHNTRAVCWANLFLIEENAGRRDSTSLLMNSKSRLPEVRSLRVYKTAMVLCCGNAEIVPPQLLDGCLHQVPRQQCRRDRRKHVWINPSTSSTQLVSLLYNYQTASPRFFLMRFQKTEAWTPCPEVHVFDRRCRVCLPRSPFNSIKWSLLDF